MFFLTIKKVLLLLACIFLGGYFLDSSTLLSFNGHSGAFVIPLVKKNNTTYVLVGLESGGKDKGTYCVPGGSSGWGIFRDTNPLDTASREFCEETLTDLDYHTVRTLIDTTQRAQFVDVLHTKKIVTYVVPFTEALIDDIIKKFFYRRSATWFWQYYYREMDCFALIRLKDIVVSCKKHHSGQKCWVRGLVYDSHAQDYKELNIVVRPILKQIIKKHRFVLRSYE